MKFIFSGGPGIIYAVNSAGQLLFYRDNTQNGTGDVNSPSVIGQGGWLQFTHLFYGGNGIIYGVNPQGQLLFYRDNTRNGTGDVHSPSVIGQGGWNQSNHTPHFALVRKSAQKAENTLVAMIASLVSLHPVRYPSLKQDVIPKNALRQSSPVVRYESRRWRCG